MRPAAGGSNRQLLLVQQLIQQALSKCQAASQGGGAAHHAAMHSGKPLLSSALSLLEERRISHLAAGPSRSLSQHHQAARHLASSSAPALQQQRQQQKKKNQARVQPQGGVSPELSSSMPAAPAPQPAPLAAAAAAVSTWLAEGAPNPDSQVGRLADTFHRACGAPGSPLRLKAGSASQLVEVLGPLVHDLSVAVEGVGRLRGTWFSSSKQQLHWWDYQGLLLQLGLASKRAFEALDSPVQYEKAERQLRPQERRQSHTATEREQLATLAVLTAARAAGKARAGGANLGKATQAPVVPPPTTPPSQQQQQQQQLQQLSSWLLHDAVPAVAGSASLADLSELLSWRVRAAWQLRLRAGSSPWIDAGLYGRALQLLAAEGQSLKAGLEQRASLTSSSSASPWYSKLLSREPDSAATEQSKQEIQQQLLLLREAPLIKDPLRWVYHLSWLHANASNPQLTLPLLAEVLRHIDFLAPRLGNETLSALAAPLASACSTPSEARAEQLLAPMLGSLASEVVSRVGQLSPRELSSWAVRLSDAVLAHEEAAAAGMPAAAAGPLPEPSPLTPDSSADAPSVENDLPAWLKSAVAWLDDAVSWLDGGAQRAEALMEASDSKISSVGQLRELSRSLLIATAVQAAATVSPSPSSSSGSERCKAAPLATHEVLGLAQRLKQLGVAEPRATASLSALLRAALPFMSATELVDSAHSMAGFLPPLPLPSEPRGSNSFVWEVAGRAAESGLKRMAGTQLSFVGSADPGEALAAQRALLPASERDLRLLLGELVAAAAPAVQRGEVPTPQVLRLLVAAVGGAVKEREGGEAGPSLTVLLKGALLPASRWLVGGGGGGVAVSGARQDAATATEAVLASAALDLPIRQPLLSAGPVSFSTPRPRHAAAALVACGRLGLRDPALEEGLCAAVARGAPGLPPDVQLTSLAGLMLLDLRPPRLIKLLADQVTALHAPRSDWPSAQQQQVAGPPPHAPPSYSSSTPTPPLAWPAANLQHLASACLMLHALHHPGAKPFALARSLISSDLGAAIRELHPRCLMELLAVLGARGHVGGGSDNVISPFMAVLGQLRSELQQLSNDQSNDQGSDHSRSLDNSASSVEATQRTAPPAPPPASPRPTEVAEKERPQEQPLLLPLEEGWPSRKWDTCREVLPLLSEAARVAAASDRSEGGRLGWGTLAGDALVSVVVSSLDVWPPDQHARLAEMVALLAGLASSSSSSYHPTSSSPTLPASTSDLQLSELVSEQVYSAVRLGFQRRFPLLPLAGVVSGTTAFVATAPDREAKDLAEAAVAELQGRSHELHLVGVDEVALMVSLLHSVLLSAAAAERPAAAAPPSRPAWSAPSTRSAPVANGDERGGAAAVLWSAATAAVAWRLEGGSPTALLRLAEALARRQHSSPSSSSASSSDHVFAEALTRRLFARLETLNPEQLLLLSQLVCPKDGLKSSSRPSLVKALSRSLCNNMALLTASQVTQVMQAYRSWHQFAGPVSKAVVAEVRRRPSQFQVHELLHICHALHTLRRHQLFDPGHLNPVAGALLLRAHLMNLEQLQATASIMQRCSRRQDMRAFQAHFVRQLRGRQQLGGRAAGAEARPMR